MTLLGDVTQREIHLIRTPRQILSLKRPLLLTLQLSLSFAKVCWILDVSVFAEVGEVVPIGAWIILLLSIFYP